MSIIRNKIISAPDEKSPFLARTRSVRENNQDQCGEGEAELVRNLIVSSWIGDALTLTAKVRTKCFPTLLLHEEISKAIKCSYQAWQLIGLR